MVSTSVESDRAEISVVDQGIGIPEGELDRIFERFYRVDPARHRSTGGTGLGLSIVKHVAATHGGEVRVWSVHGEGSTFTLTLPLGRVRESLPDPAFHTDPASGPVPGAAPRSLPTPTAPRQEIHR